MIEEKSAAGRRGLPRYLRLLPYSQVKERILNALAGRNPRVEKVTVGVAQGRICAETILSPFNVPAFATSAMDGYAIRSLETRRADCSLPVLFNVRGSLYPGSKIPPRRLRELDAYYVGTGAPVPDGADAVVKIEETRSLDRRIQVHAMIPRWKNIVRIGENCRAGSVVVRKGQIVNAADIALMVEVGVKDLSVYSVPRMGILSIGSELTTLDNEKTGKKVNNYSTLIAGYLIDAGAIPVPLGVARDDVKEILRILNTGIKDVDGLVTIGGSSVGKRDLTAAALREFGDCREIFHGIRLVPVRPTGLYTARGKAVILLPGHSIAASLSFFLVVKPIVNLLSGLGFESRAAVVRARLTDSVSNPRPIGALFLAKMAVSNGDYEATPLPWGSDRISSLADANAFFELRPRQTMKSGDTVVTAFLGTKEISRIS